MGTEPEHRVELGKDRPQDAPRVQDAPEPPAEPVLPVSAWADIETPAPPELPPYPAPPLTPGPVYPGYAAPGNPGPAGYPGAPGYAQPGYPQPGYPGYPQPGYPVAQPGFGAPYPYGQLPYGQPVPYPPTGYGYRDSSPVWSIVSFSCVAASLVGGAMLCGLPLLLTVPAGIVTGLVGHGKGEQLGKWAAIANAAVGVLAAILVVLFLGAISGFS